MHTSPELHSLFTLIYPTNHLFIHMIHDDLCRAGNATTNAAMSMAMEVLLCPLFVSGVVVERRAQSDNVDSRCDAPCVLLSYIGYTYTAVAVCRSLYTCTCSVWSVDANYR